MCLVTLVTLQRMQELNTGSTAAILRDQADNEPPDSDERRAIFYAAHSPSPSMLPRPSSPAPAKGQPKWKSDSQVDLGYKFKPSFDDVLQPEAFSKSAVHSMLQAFPKYIGFIVYSHSSSCQ